MRSMAKEPDELMAELEQAYSNALWAWACVESALAMVFFEVISGDKSHWEPVSAAFFAVHSFEIRLTMVHAAAEIQWKKTPHLETWKKIRAECDEQARQRGKIAHLSGTTFPPEKPHQQEIAILTHSSLLHPLYPNTHGSAKNVGYDAKKLWQMTSRWRTLCEGIQSLALQSSRERLKKQQEAFDALRSDLSR